MDFFENQVTLYHFNKNNVARIEFKAVYFRHDINSRSNSKGVEKGSSGSITIPTTKELEIAPNDYIVEGIVTDNFNLASLMQKYKVYKVVSVADYRKGNLQHYRIEVSE